MAENKWVPPQQPPPPLFLGKKERDLTKQVNDELIERVIGQTLLYFPLDVRSTHYHPIYGEAIKKNFGRPIVIKALIKLETQETTTEVYGLDKDSKLVVNFHHRRLTEDQDLFVREGDIIFYGLQFFEITKLSEPRTIFGQVEHKMEIKADCNRVREGTFHEPIAALQIREALRAQQTTATVEAVIASTPVPTACDGRINLVSGKRTSFARGQFLDYASNPQNYAGCIIYLTEFDADETYGIFVTANKFYFNEGGSWIESPFLVA